MRHLLTVLLPLLLMGSAMGGEPAWKAKELERTARVDALIEQLADASPENREAAYAELRDSIVRKRDIPALTQEISRNASPEVKKSLGKLIPLMEEGWRLPEKGWTSDKEECDKAYHKEFKELGGSACRIRCDYAPKLFFELEVFEFPAEAEIRSDAVSLILTLEPESLRLWGVDETDGDSWEPISYVGLLSNLQELTLFITPETDLTPLKGLTKLRKLSLVHTPVTDLTPLAALSSLNELVLDIVPVTDLSPLAGLSNLRELDLEKVPVTDLTPLKGLTGLRKLYLLNTAVTDFSPLKGLPDLKTIQYED